MLLEPVEPPPEFSAIQAARLTAWAESSESEELAKLLSQLSEVLDPDPRQIDVGATAAAAREMSRIEVAEATLEYCAAFFAFNQAQDSATADRLGPAYDRFTLALAPISEEDVHELLDRYLGDFAAQQADEADVE